MNSETEQKITKPTFEELVRKIKERKAREAMLELVEKENPVEVDLTSLGLSKEVTEEEVVEVISDIATGINPIPAKKELIKETLIQLNEAGVKEQDEEVEILGVSRKITLNAKQQAFHNLVLSGKSCVLIGAAGSGKTTCMRQVTESLVSSPKLLPLLQSNTKWLVAGLPGAVILSFTNKAVNNIKHAVTEKLKRHTITAHKLLEFQPIFYDIEDPTTGIPKKTMRFEPTRTTHNPLPYQLKFIAWEESSMISVDLYNLVQDAMQHEHQEVFLGDIQQLPPVFGLAILGFKMLELPVVELTEIYRQAANSPIISLAHKLLAGNQEVFSPLDFEDRKEYHHLTGKLVTRRYWTNLDNLSYANEDGSVKFQSWQKTLEPETALKVFSKQCIQWIKDGYYNPERDIILCPYNKAFGTIELNKEIAQYLGTTRNAEVWEVIAGFNKHYLAVGDRVLYDKEDAIITGIAHNGSYLGKMPQIHATTLDRWGHHQEQLSTDELNKRKAEFEEASDSAVEDFFLSPDNASVEDRVHSASHVITVRLRYADPDDPEREITLESAADINNLLGGYALTVHKYQGSEEDNVILVLHASHAKMVSRELLYTAVTRAKKRLHIVAESFSFFKGIKSQRIKGDTLTEKAEFFKGKGDTQTISVTKSSSIPQEEYGGPFSEQGFEKTTAKGNDQDETIQVSTINNCSNHGPIEESSEQSSVSSSENKVPDKIEDLTKQKILSSDKVEDTRDPKSLSFAEKVALIKARQKALDKKD